jgi:hypothetical protein
MATKSFSAFVKNGQLSFGESLSDLEGQQVVVTLAPTPGSLDTDRASEQQPPDWLEVEQNAVFRLPYQWEPVQVKIVDAGAIPPAVILPQELLDGKSTYTTCRLAYSRR